MFLLNPKKKKSVAHLWAGSDTVCKMYSTGGMRKKKQAISATPMGKPICTMCQSVNSKSNKPVFYFDLEYQKAVENYVTQLPHI